LAINLLVLRENVVLFSSLIAVPVALYVLVRFRFIKVFPAKLLLKIYNERSSLIKKAMSNRSSSDYTDR